MSSRPLPIGEIKYIHGRCLVLRGDDIDTDRIIPARFLKCVNFLKLGEQVFADDRKALKGNHPFDDPINKDASILIVNENFGCGSSREHAPQALIRWGIRGVIGESFAEIFYGNCLALGIPCGTASKDEIKELQAFIEKKQNLTWEMNLQTQELRSPEKSCKLGIKQGPLEMLISGRWDATSQLVDRKNKIYKVKDKLPYLNNFQINLSN